MVRIIAFLLSLPFLVAGIPAEAQPVSPLRVSTLPQDSHRQCRDCHRSHGMAKAERPRPRLTLDPVCLACHQGPSVPATDHGARKLPGWAGSGSRHGEEAGAMRPGTDYTRSLTHGRLTFVLRDDCSACHDVHSKKRGMLSERAFDERGQFLGAKPVSTAQICYGCHAGSEAAPTFNADPDVGALFARRTVSSHTIGRSSSDRPDLPSLRNSLFHGKLDCTSCHDNPDPAGPRGPHVSPYPSLLKANYGRELDAGGIGERSNDLCYTCHDRNSILSNQSFPLHRQHLVGFTGGVQARGWEPERGAPLLPAPRNMASGRPSPLTPGFGEPTPCATCHDPHGSRQNPSLIRFDRSIVSSSSMGPVAFYRSGLGQGTCTLSCHGYDHIQKRY